MGKDARTWLDAYRSFFRSGNDAQTWLDTTAIDLAWPWRLSGEPPQRLFVRTRSDERTNATQPKPRLLQCLPGVLSPEAQSEHSRLGRLWIVPWINDYVEYEDIPFPVFGFWSKLARRPKPRCGGERVDIRPNCSAGIYLDTVRSRVTQLRYAYNLDYEWLSFFFNQVHDVVFNGPALQSDVTIPLRVGHTQRLIWRWYNVTSHSFVKDLRDRALSEAFRFGFGSEVGEALRELADLYQVAEKWSWDVASAFRNISEAVTTNQTELRATSIELPPRLDLLPAARDRTTDWKLLGRLDCLAELIGKVVPCIDGELLRAADAMPRSPVSTDQSAPVRQAPACPADLEPTSAAEMLEWEIARRIAPKLVRRSPHMPPDGEHEQAMTRFLKRFNMSPHHRTVWEHYNKLRKLDRDDLPRWEAEAKHAGLELWDFVAKLVLPCMESFIALNGIPLPPEPPETQTFAAPSSVEVQASGPQDEGGTHGFVRPLPYDPACRKVLVRRLSAVSWTLPDPFGTLSWNHESNPAALQCVSWTETTHAPADWGHKRLIVPWIQGGHHNGYELKPFNANPWTFLVRISHDRKRSIRDSCKAAEFADTVLFRVQLLAVACAKDEFALEAFLGELDHAVHHTVGDAVVTMKTGRVMRLVSRWLESGELNDLRHAATYEAETLDFGDALADAIWQLVETYLELLESAMKHAAALNSITLNITAPMDVLRGLQLVLPDVGSGLDWSTPLTAVERFIPRIEARRTKQQTHGPVPATLNHPQCDDVSPQSGSTPSTIPPVRVATDSGYLGLSINTEKRTVSRPAVSDIAVPLSEAQLRIVVAMRKAGSQGITSEVVESLRGGERSAARQFKTELNSRLSVLAVKMPPRQWRLVETDETSA